MLIPLYYLIPKTNILICRYFPRNRKMSPGNFVILFSIDIPFRCFHSNTWITSSVDVTNLDLIRSLFLITLATLRLLCTFWKLFEHVLKCLLRIFCWPRAHFFVEANKWSSWKFSVRIIFLLIPPRYSLTNLRDCWFLFLKIFMNVLCFAGTLTIVLHFLNCFVH